MKTKLIIIALLNVLIGTSVFAQKKVKIKVTEDSFITGGEDASKNFGKDYRIYLKKADPKSKSYRRAFFKFDLSNVTEVNTAVLYVTARAAGSQAKPNDVVEAQVLLTDANWTEGEITANNQPATTDVVGLVTIKQTDVHEEYKVVLDAEKVAAAIKKNGILSLCMEMTNENTTMAALYSKESKTDGSPSEKQAYLEINGKTPKK